LGEGGQRAMVWLVRVLSKHRSSLDAEVSPHVPNRYTHESCDASFMRINILPAPITPPSLPAERTRKSP
jgi:hypothetical protein